MEAGTLAAQEQEPFWERARALGRQRPWLVALIVLLVVVFVLIALEGVHAVAQRGLFGLSTGSIYALGAVGLTLVYGILKLTNFAHGDFLAFGAYMAYVVNITWGLPLVLGVLFAMLMTAVVNWRYNRHFPAELKESLSLPADDGPLGETLLQKWLLDRRT